MAEKMLREAIEAGEFDNLPGKGQPVDLSENPFEDPDLRVVHKLLRDAGFAPAWIEERKDIDATFEAAYQTLTRAWRIYRPEVSRRMTPRGKGTSLSFVRKPLNLTVASSSII